MCSGWSSLGGTRNLQDAVSIRETVRDFRLSLESSVTSNTSRIFRSMISLTESAAKRAKELLKDSDYVGLRPGVQGGGCSGFSYTLKMSDGPEPDDKVIESHGVEIHIDKKSYLYLIGTQIDFVTENLQSGFKFVNPNAKRTCGCGESFSV